MKENYTAGDMAEHFGCSKKLIYKICYLHGLKFHNKYYDGSNAELRNEIMMLHNRFPNSGSQVSFYLWCF